MTPLPRNRKAWLVEIAAAYLDAAEAIPFGPLVGGAFGARDLFHLGPATTFKFRGLTPNRRLTRTVTDAALASYVSTLSRGQTSLSHPAVAFAFTYLASHFALDLVTERMITGLMDYIEKHPQAIAPPSIPLLLPPSTVAGPHNPLAPPPTRKLQGSRPGRGSRGRKGAA